jgi:pimeloyl-ACP methyl ester carboxylesterase
MPVLTEHYTVIAPDLRGTGDSGKPLIGYDKRSLVIALTKPLSQTHN